MRKTKPTEKPKRQTTIRRDPPRRAFLERAGLVATAFLVGGAASSVAEAAARQPAGASAKVGDVLKLTAAQQKGLTARARNLTAADLSALATMQFEKTPAMSELTVGDLKSLTDVVARKFAGQPQQMTMAAMCKRIPPFCCCCTCCGA
jgi:hypothetical protein